MWDFYFTLRAVKAMFLDKQDLNDLGESCPITIS
jgi:hypothetical protein